MSEEFGQVSNIYRLRKILERAVEEKFKGDVDITDGGTSLNGKQADFVFNLHEDRFSVNINKLK